MAHTIYLTTEDKKIFDKLPDELKSTCTVVDETIEFEDTAERFSKRMKYMSVEHPKLKELQEQARTKDFSVEEAEEIAENIDLSSISESDTLELYFAWGPSILSGMIINALAQTSSTEELEGIAHLSNLRHGLLLSLTTEVV